MTIFFKHQMGNEMPRPREHEGRLDSQSELRKPVENSMAKMLHLIP